MDTEYTKGFKAGLVWEHERIIKLLEKHNCILDGCHHSDNLCSSAHHLGLLLKLIKGETNG